MSLCKATSFVCLPQWTTVQSVSQADENNGSYKRRIYSLGDDRFSTQLIGDIVLKYWKHWNHGPARNPNSLARKVTNIDEKTPATMTTTSAKDANNTESTTAVQSTYPPIVEFPSNSYILQHEQIIREFIPAKTKMAHLANKLRTFEENSESYKQCHALAILEHKKCEEISARAGIPFGQMPTIDILEDIINNEKKKQEAAEKNKRQKREPIARVSPSPPQATYLQATERSCGKPANRPFLSRLSRSQANPEYKNTPQAYSSSDTESYSSNMSEDVTSRIQTMQVDDDDQQADQPIKKAYIPPIIVDDPVNGKQLLEDLNHLTNEAVTGRVIGNKLKIFPPSAEAHRVIRREISDERKLKSHTYLLPQEKQLKVVIRGLPNDFPTKEIEEFLMSEGFEVQFVTQLRHRSGKGNMPLFLGVLPKSEKSKSIFLMENLSYFRIKVEPLRKKAGPAYYTADAGNDQEMAARVVIPKPPKIPPIFIKCRSDWRDTLSILRAEVDDPIRAQISGQFVRINVESEDNFRHVIRFLDSTGMEASLAHSYYMPLKTAYRNSSKYPQVSIKLS
ncbi:RNA-directed DNA polymerase from mobile element jockey [Caerostris darwini]|uniref:RNA-directed DNA polymerase from mobile element jockey n=1 Tax=Caerostris darwini TaxID=1538125 RepID=A0AAV4NHF9_9ARAC|nr:RNA-directed DNA polymerase from mobile element jockey [Caerostris darwini]